MSIFNKKNGRSLDGLVYRKPPTELQLFWKNPTLYIAEILYKRRLTVPNPPSSAISVVCISDTHNSQIEVPPGDILICAGDSTQSGTLDELQTTIDWLRSLPHPHKIVIAGNHDLILDSNLDKKIAGNDSARANIDWSGLIYLNNSRTTLSFDSGRQLKIFGSPFTPQHGSWAFQYPRLRDVWTDSVPDDVDILVTHGPPKSHLDLNHAGCSYLLAELWRTRPRLHVFGHIHAGHGQEWLRYDRLQEAYEAAVKAGGGLRALAQVVYEFISGFFRSRARPRTLLVNASIVGGMRDELRRKPVQVVI